MTIQAIDKLTDDTLRMMKKSGLIRFAGFGSHKKIILTPKGVRYYESHPMHPNNRGNN
jgi:predicted transcriptional regulator